MNQSVKVAVIQDSPVIMDRDATIEKVAKLTKRAAEQKAKIVLFPEAFIPAYPRGMYFGAKVGIRSDDGKTDFHRYSTNAVAIPSSSMNSLSEIARKNEVFLIVGIIEKESQYSKSTL